jgi:osmotically-inducible protein OsmY
VTLKGPVRSEAEKAAVEAKAAAVVGQAKVTNQIEIKP